MTRAYTTLRKSLAVFLVSLMLGPQSGAMFASTTPLPVTPLGIANQKLAREIESEAVVMLKNDGLLPLNLQSNKLADARP